MSRQLTSIETHGPVELGRPSMRYAELACRPCARTGREQAAASMEKSPTTESRLSIRSSLDRRETTQAPRFLGRGPSQPLQPVNLRLRGRGRVDIRQREEDLDRCYGFPAPGREGLLTAKSSRSAYGNAVIPAGHHRRRLRTHGGAGMKPLHVVGTRAEITASPDAQGPSRLVCICLRGRLPAVSAG